LVKEKLEVSFQGISVNEAINSESQ